MTVTLGTDWSLAMTSFNRRMRVFPGVMVDFLATVPALEFLRAPYYNLIVFMRLRMPQRPQQMIQNINYSFIGLWDDMTRVVCTRVL